MSGISSSWSQSKDCLLNKSEVGYCELRSPRFESSTTRREVNARLSFHHCRRR